MSENKFVTDNRKKTNTKTFSNLGISKIVEKIKKVKHLEVAIAIMVISVVLVFVISAFGGSSEKVNATQNSQNYYSQVENRLSEVLSKINGAGRVSVMINYSGTSEIITATTSNTSQDKTTDTDTSGNRTTESKTENVSPVIIQKNGEDTPLIVKEILPDIVGVLVVAEGANNMAVKINLMQAVQTLLDVSADKIEIFAMK